MFVLKLQCHLAYKGRMLAVLVYRYLLTIKVTDISDCLEISVAVATEYKVYATSVCNDVLVGELALVPSEMRDEHHEVALLLVFQQIGIFLGLGHGVEELHALAVGLGHQTLHLRVKGKDTNSESLALQDDVGLYLALKHCAREVVVAAKDGEVGHVGKTGQVVETEVELMVTNSGGIDMHHIHQPHLYVSLEHGVVG